MIEKPQLEKGLHLFFLLEMRTYPVIYRNHIGGWLLGLKYLTRLDSTTAKVRDLSWFWSFSLRSGAFLTAVKQAMCISPAVGNDSIGNDSIFFLCVISRFGSCCWSSLCLSLFS